MSGGLRVFQKADGDDLRLLWMLAMGGQSVSSGHAESFLFLDGGHGFLGGVVQVVRCRDGQAALAQNPLGLVDVGPWQTRGKKNTVTTGNDQNDKKNTKLA